MTSMKYKILVLAIALAGASFIVGCNSDNGSSSDVSFESHIDSVSYSLGYQMAEMSLKPQGMTDIETEAMEAGIKAALNNEESQFSDQEMQQIIQNYQMKSQQQAQQQQQQEAKTNAKEGQEFLSSNLEDEEVQETESGLQYQVLEEGSGESPDSTSTVEVHYEGTLIDGTVFDSSYDRGEPVQFPLDKVIPGWTEGLQLMEEGATYKFFIPGDLAYGQNAPPQSPIGPNETLIFEVELLEVDPENGN